jgi:class 3 adenylate cyclase
MIGCSKCGQDNPAGFRFCGACGSPLVEVPRHPAGEERKVVTVLFCDLVGFTARSDQADPEDVGAMLRPFHARLRAEIERVGGTLDKLIGDAVMAVFGVPAVHEDDPERAVRCALRMLDAIADLNRAHPALGLAVRIGVNTGEALVALEDGPDSEGVVGDVVNTAARLQGVAPVGGVVVGEATWRATQTLFEYEQRTPVQVKGKAEPVPIWRVLGVRSRPGVDVTEQPVTPLIGRDEELAALRHCYEQAFGEHAVWLVTVLGEPGLGKSRLVRELAGFVDAQPELVAWRRGHCLSHGEAVGYWALGEIIKAQAGILESDDPREVAAKLGAAVGPGAAHPARQPGAGIRPAAAGVGAGRDRGAPRHARGRAQDPAPGGRGVRQGVLVRSARRHGGRRRGGGPRRPGPARAQGADPRRPPVGGGGCGRVQLLARAHPRRGLRPGPQDQPFPPPPGGRRVDPGPRR